MHDCTPGDGVLAGERLELRGDAGDVASIQRSESGDGYLLRLIKKRVKHTGGYRTHVHRMGENIFTASTYAPTHAAFCQACNRPGKLIVDSLHPGVAGSAAGKCSPCLRLLVGFLEVFILWLIAH